MLSQGRRRGDGMGKDSEGGWEEGQREKVGARSQGSKGEEETRYVKGAREETLFVDSARCSASKEDWGGSVCVCVCVFEVREARRLSERRETDCGHAREGGLREVD
eukprot:1493368-Rhodomonas_salina.1